MEDLTSEGNMKTLVERLDQVKLIDCESSPLQNVHFAGDWEHGIRSWEALSTFGAY